MSKLLESMAVMCELTGTEWSEPTVKVIEKELSCYPLPDTLHALERCQRELKHKVTLADILNRLPGQHPGVEQAWAVVSAKVASDVPTIFVTEEMREAYGAALALEGDMIAARMAFKEVYAHLVAQANVARKLPVWSMMPGTDSNQREVAIQVAVRRGYVGLEWAKKQLPVEAHQSIEEIAGTMQLLRIA